jgi:Cd2+/Zn2+-exporting ATPase
MEITTFQVADLCCADEERLIRKRLSSVVGVDRLAFDYVSHRLVAHHTCHRNELSDALREIGFTCRLKGGPEATQSRWEQHHIAASSLISGLLLGLGLILRGLGAAEYLCILIFACSIVSGGWKIALKALAALKQWSLDMNALMIIAAIGAFAIRRFEEGAAVVFFFGG